jgi:ABC-type glycerol-3-phosphate transport system substrate-binding protein
VTQGYAQLDTDFSNQLALMLAGKVGVDQGLNTAAQEANKALAGS